MEFGRSGIATDGNYAVIGSLVTTSMALEWCRLCLRYNKITGWQLDSKLLPDDAKSDPPGRHATLPLWHLAAISTTMFVAMPTESLPFMFTDIQVVSGQMNAKFADDLELPISVPSSG